MNIGTLECQNFESVVVFLFEAWLWVVWCTRQMLGIEERKEEARNGLETAVQSRSPEMLEDALEEVKGHRKVWTPFG